MGKVRSSCRKAQSSSKAQVVELVDTLASGASARKGVEVQVLSWAPNQNLIISIIVLKPALYLRYSYIYCT